MIHSAEKRSMRASATVLACLGRAQSEELPHTFPILRTWVRCGVMSRISKEAHRRDLTGFVVSVFRILDRFGIIAFWKRLAPGAWEKSYPIPGQNLATGVPAGAAGTSCRLARYRRSEQQQAMPAKGWAKCAVAPGCRAQSKAASKTRFTCDTWYE